VTGSWPSGRPPERPPAATARALADLARAGHQVLDEPSMQVEFEIHHGVDRPGTLADTMAALPDDRRFAETLASASNGAGLVVGTRVGEYRAAGRPGEHRPWLHVAESTESRTVFRGSERPNLAFRHESAEVLEGIISIEDEPRKMLLRHGLAILDTLRHVAETAAHAGDAPLLSLQCPAQLPPTQTYRGADDIGGRVAEPARSSSTAIRFAMALNQPSADVRLQIADRLARHCIERGLGLWLGDTRSGYRTGNWFLVLAHDRPLARRSYRRAADHHRAGNAAEGCLPVTLVGPARAGSTYAILSFLSQFPEVGVLGCAMTTLNELAFHHLQLAVNGASRPRLAAVNAALAELRATELGPGDLLRRLVPHLLHAGDPPPAGREHIERLIGRAGDYQTAIGPALPMIADNAMRRIPIWVSWQMRRQDTGLQLPLVALQRAVERLDLVDPGAPSVRAGTPSTEYLLCRQVGSSTVTGKGKLAVSKNLVERRFPGLPSSPARLCAELRDAWEAELTAAGHTGRLGELSVSVHESWLGQSVAPG
jgi:hypothetical protein